VAFFAGEPEKTDLNRFGRSRDEFPGPISGASGKTDESEEVAMFKAIHDRLNRDEKGFTLIELMVVVLIIAILIAIAIPTFLGARQRAQDKQAQSNLRNALVTEDEFYTDNQAYSETAADLEALEPQLDWASTAADAGGVTATLGSDDQTVILESESVSGTVFCLGKVASGADAGTYYGKEASGTACPADPTAAPYQVTTAGWK
jgi:type IV pilus assembly protein PilA